MGDNEREVITKLGKMQKGKKSCESEKREGFGWLSTVEEALTRD